MNPLTRKVYFQRNYKETKAINDFANNRPILASIEVAHYPDPESEHEIGIKAKATIKTPIPRSDSFLVNTITSGGIWGLSQDLNEKEIKNWHGEELHELMETLHMYNVFCDCVIPIKFY